MMRRSILLAVCTVFFNLVQSQGIQVQIRVYLQGAYAGGGLMTTHLNAGNHLPLNQPYNTGIWAYPGTEALNSIPAQMVDWILLDLRSAPDTAVARKACVLYSDGSVRDVTGNSQIQFNVPPGNYYVAVLHKSHLSAMSAARLALPASGLLDFSDTAAFPLYGRCVIQLAGGVEAMIAGDITDDKMLKYSGSNNDRSPILQRILGVVGGTAINALIQGYYREDLRMDGNVKYSGSNNDPSMIIQNLVTLTGSNAINATFAGPVPHAVYRPLPSQPSPILGPAMPCQNEAGLVYNVIQVAGLVYTWVVPNGWMITSGQGTHEITVTAGMDPGIIVVTPSNSAGQGLAQTLALAPQVCGTGGYPPGFVHCDSAVPTAVISVTNPITGKIWMDRNLGAAQVATSSTDFLAYGDLYQWGRFADGHQCRTSSTTTTLSQTDQPGHGSFIRGSDDWRSLPNDNLWQGETGINNPCPTGYRIPTEAELNEERLSWSSNNIAGAYASPLKWTMGGYRYFANGAVDIVGYGAYYWSSTVNGFNARYLDFYSTNASMTGTLRAYGLSVRCIQVDPPPCTPQPDQANAGPDSLNIQGTSIQLQANTPVNGSGQWTVVSGLGGSFADDTTATTLFNGVAGSTYNLAWTITTVCGSNSDTVVIGFASPQVICPDSLVDNRDGQVYPVVQIGNQCWMGGNLNLGVKVNSQNLGYVHSDMADNMVVEKYCYNNDEASCDVYGGLYDWNEAMEYQTTEGSRGICPAGWHIPTDGDWNVLSSFLGGDQVAGGKMKEEGTIHWNSPNEMATNSSGFTGLGAGYRYSTGVFQNLLSFGYFWTSSTDTGGLMISRTLVNFAEMLVRNTNHATSGFSIRCLMDTVPACTPQPDQANAGPDQLLLQGTSVQLQANQPVNGTGTWRVYSGTGGSFADSTLNNTMFNGTAGETYQLAWIIRNACGYNSDLVTISFVLQNSFMQCGDILIDIRDGQQYPTIQLGKQCWMAKNLNLGSMIAGSGAQQDNGLIEKYCYDDLAANCSEFGGFYQWGELMDYDSTPASQGICPDGWHVPTDSEWTYMTRLLDAGVDSLIWGYSGRNAGAKMKATGTTHWTSPNVGATNYSGFAALGSGIRNHDATFANYHNFTFFWSSTRDNLTYPVTRYLYYNYPYVGRGYDNYHSFGFSIRCLHDSSFVCSPQPDQAYAGPDTIHTGGASIQLMGNQAVHGLGEWTITVGSNGSFADSSQYNTLFYGQAGETYTLVWSISNLCNRTSDQVNISFSSGAAFQQCGDTLTDTRDFQRYPTVRIGTQCWMARNLNVGDMILGLSSPSNNGSIEKYCYVNNTANCTEYGGLYQWGEMMNYSTLEGAQGICPTGWHIPASSEWLVLANFLGGTTLAGGAMKEPGIAHWQSPNTGATNSSGFTALPGGRRESKGGFNFINAEVNYWSSSSYIAYTLYYNTTQIQTQSTVSSLGYTIRCVMDSILPCVPQPDQANAGPDSLNIQGTSIQLQANTPVNGSGQWSVVSGQGGSFADDTLAATLFSGVAGSTYNLIWTISTVCGSNSDTVVIAFASPQFICPDSLVDNRDGQVYPVVQIGNQCWMGRNLNVGVKVNSQNLGYVHSDMADNLVIEKYCYNNDETNCDIYGGLYDWNEAMEYQTTEGSRGICPAGWHIPTDGEWTVLSDFLGGALVAGGKMKEEGTVHWTSPNEMATNSSGFTGLGAGYRYYFNGTFQHLNSYAYFWSSSTDTSGLILSRTLIHFYEPLVRNTNYVSSGHSVRCLMDTMQVCTPQPDQANAGPDQLLVPATSVQLAANQPVNGIGQWRVYSGQGGSFADSTLNNTAFTGMAGTSYQLVWIIQNACGYTSDLVTVSFAAVSICPDSLIDTRDGQSYPVVEIDGRCWMGRNLNVGIMTNSVYTGAEHSDLSNDGIIEKYCYNNDPAQCGVYGGLYEWQEMMGYMMSPGVPGICPAGWHIPTVDEWQGMITFLGGSWVAGGELKEAGYDHWLSPNSGATNNSGFTALPGNIRYGDGVFSVPQAQGAFWSSNMEYETNAWAFILHYDDAYLSQTGFNFPNGLSVRCIMDTTIACSPLPTAAIAGPDKLGQAVTSLYLEGNQPVQGQGVWQVVSGTGGIFADSTLHNTLFSGVVNEFYELSWTITTPCAYSMDRVYVEFITPATVTCGSDIYDSRDGQVYATLQIGTQCWMARNLNVGTFAQSQATGLTHSDVSNNGIIEKYCWGNDISFCDTFGGLYDWNEMMAYETTPKAQGICPPGWHIPDSLDWAVLSNFLGGDALAGGMLKDTGTAFWASPNDGATNTTGFTALPSGNRDPGGSFGNIHYNTTFWSSTSYDPQHAWYRDIGYNGPTFVSSFHPMEFGFGIRCIANDSLPCAPQPDQANAGPDQLNLTTDTALLQANTPANGSGIWSILSGNNGWLDDPASPVTVLHGSAGETYVLEWCISNGCGSSCDALTVSFISTQAFNCGSMLTDTRDAQQYPTTLIGTRCWMAANLNIGTYVESQYTGVGHSDVGNNGVIEKYCYDNQITNCNLYGGLYDWNEAMAYTSQEGAQGICPDGWHIPSDSEWVDATMVLGGEDIAGGRMKLTGLTYWAQPNAAATNFSGFSALPGGYRYFNGSFSELGFYGDHMSSTLYTTDYFVLRGLYNVNGTIYRGLEFLNNGVSVRCIHDDLYPCNDLPDNANGGPDSLDIPGTSYALQAISPANGTGQWIILAGAGGVLSDPSNANATLTGLPGVLYTLYWTVATQCSTNVDQVVISFENSLPPACGGGITDPRDGRQYATVLIGMQCWMAQNLNVGVWVNSNLTGTTHSDVNDNGIIEKYCYDNDTLMCNDLGGLYDWNEMMGYANTPGVQGICPLGWHIPTDAEWCTMTTTLDSTVSCNDFFSLSGTDAGGRMKETGIIHWSPPNTGATNSSGFTAFGGGYRYSYGGLEGLFDEASFWSSSVYSSSDGIYWSVFYDNAYVVRGSNDKTNGFSVRCLKD